METLRLKGEAMNHNAYPEERSEKQAKILLAMFAASDPKEALQRAYAMARASGARLYVLGVLPEFLRSNMVFPQLHLFDAMRTIEMSNKALRMIRASCERTLPTQLANDELIIRQGAFLPTVLEVAQELSVGMIVLPSVEGKLGHRVTKLARLSGVPVLVARRPGATDTIIAASDLNDPKYPVLSQANHLSQALDAPVVMLHNIPSSLPESKFLEAYRELSARQDRLRNALPNVSHDSLVMSALHTTEAILSVARSRRADMIVVGAHRRGWVERLLAPRGVAAQIVERASRSVLVTPLAA
jgi:nucleotide-binding universal stress UspA family protein